MERSGEQETKNGKQGTDDPACTVCTAEKTGKKGEGYPSRAEPEDRTTGRKKKWTTTYFF